MHQVTKDAVTSFIAEFRLPKYEELPNVGLYLEQTTKYIAEYLAPLQDGVITASMISNYVKKGLVANPVKKQYSREQIAYLIFIAVAKAVLSMEDIRLLFVYGLQNKAYTPQRAYDYFCEELHNVLAHVFGVKEQLDTIGETNTDEKQLLRTTIIAVAHKVYLNKSFAQLQAQEAAGKAEAD